MTPSALYDIFRKKFKGMADETFVKSFKQDLKNSYGIYLNTKMGKLYFHYDPKYDSWFLTNDVVMKSNVLNYAKLKKQKETP